MSASLLSRQYWFGYRLRMSRLLLAPDDGAAVAGGASPAEGKPVSEVGLEFLPGGEMLRGGITTGELTEDTEGLPTEWTQSNATGEEEDEEAEKTAGDGKEKPDAGTKEGAASDTVPAEVPASAPDMKDWPEAARTHVAEIAKERDALKTEKETLSGEVAKLKASPPAAVVVTPTRESPLARVTDESGLTAHADLATSMRSWALRNLANGGELPKELQARIEGRKAEDITEARTLTAEETATILENTETMLTKHIPARKEWLATERDTNDWLAKEYPQYVDDTKPEGQLMAAFLTQFPQIKQLPRWKTVLASVVRGHLAFEADNKAAQAKAAGKGDAPLAPVPPGGGKGGGAGAKPPISKPKGKSTELSASMDIADLARVM